MPDRDQLISQLFEQQYKRLVRTAYRLTGSMVLAKDLVQEAFVLALVHYKELANHPCPAGWLTKTLYNLVRNENRRLVNHSEISLESIEDFPAPYMPPSLEEILPCHFSAEDQQILIWRFECQFSYQEIATRLGISEGACRMRVLRLLQKCRDFFKQLEPQ